MSSTIAKLISLSSLFLYANFGFATDTTTIQTLVNPSPLAIEQEIKSSTSNLSLVCDDEHSPQVFATTDQSICNNLSLTNTALFGDKSLAPRNKDLQIAPSCIQICITYPNGMEARCYRQCVFGFSG